MLTWPFLWLILENVSGNLLVVPLNLAITPMRVLQDPILGPECSAMFEEGEVDDRFLILLFLTLEHLRKNSSWKPYVYAFVVLFFAHYMFNVFQLFIVYAEIFAQKLLGTLICFQPLLETHFGLLTMSFWSWEGPHCVKQLNCRWCLNAWVIIFFKTSFCRP